MKSLHHLDLTGLQKASTPPQSHKRTTGQKEQGHKHQNINPQQQLLWIDILCTSKYGPNGVVAMYSLYYSVRGVVTEDAVTCH